MIRRSLSASRAGLLPILLLLVLARPAAAQTRAAAPDPLAGLDAYIERAMRDWELPGLAIAIVKDDRIVYARGFGVREIGRPERVDENTVFAVASNTKALTATALGVLSREGKLRLNDPVIRHLPEFQLADPWVTREITLRDLLSHRAGYPTSAGDLLWYGSTRTPAEVLAAARSLRPRDGFRTTYGYNNLMYVAAGEVIARAGGTSWDRFVAERFLQPLGMTRTVTSSAELRGMDNVARPHRKLDGVTTALPHRDLGAAGAAGGVHASVRDWAQWLRMQINEGRYEGRQVVDTVIIRETWHPHVMRRVSRADRERYPGTHFSGYGLGWIVSDYRARLVVEHNGGIDGMLSQTGFLPEEGLGVAVFTNSEDNGLYMSLFYAVVDRFLGADRDWHAFFREGADAPPPDPEAGRVRGTRPSLAPERYAGTYVSDVLGEARVSVENGRLRIAVARHPGLAAPLEHWHHDTFQARWQDRMMDASLVTFTLDAAGSPADLRFKVREHAVDPLEYVFRRTGS